METPSDPARRRGSICLDRKTNHNRFYAAASMTSFLVMFPVSACRILIDIASVELFNEKQPALGA
jgi:hypothetical protein